MHAPEEHADSRKSVQSPQGEESGLRELLFLLAQFAREVRIPDQTEEDGNIHRRGQLVEEERVVRHCVCHLLEEDRISDRSKQKTKSVKRQEKIVTPATSRNRSDEAPLLALRMLVSIFPLRFSNNGRRHVHFQFRCLLSLRIRRKERLLQILIRHTVSLGLHHRGPFSSFSALLRRLIPISFGTGVNPCCSKLRTLSRYSHVSFDATSSKRS
mmetsp:Transcript_53178/g.104111  ORF Transcript_53178/g.104111 Transcript_53178/m.104111 type:complete len:213 (-) Transcript_53178:19-657(-)